MILLGTMLLLSTGLLGPLMADGTGAEEAFLKGNALYMAGDFEGALDLFDRGLEAGGGRVVLLYNRGNCLFRLGRFGEALHCYLRAQAEAPLDEGLSRNIRVTRGRLGFREKEEPGFLARAMGILPFEVYGNAAVFVGSLALLAWAGHLLRGGGGLKSMALLLLALAVALPCIGGVAALKNRDRGLAVKACEALTEPSPSAGEVLFTLREGEEVFIEENLTGWLRVENQKSRRGWVRDGLVLPLP